MNIRCIKVFRLQVLIVHSIILADWIYHVWCDILLWRNNGQLHNLASTKLEQDKYWAVHLLVQYCTVNNGCNQFTAFYCYILTLSPSVKGLVIVICTVAKACIAEQQRLAVENAELRQEVEKLKSELVSAEVKHGGECHCYFSPVLLRLKITEVNKYTCIESYV